MSNEPRLNYATAAPASLQALLAFTKGAAPSLDPRLRELINLRVSQINGCAFCMDMHSSRRAWAGNADAECARRLAEAHRQFGPRERAALAWAEAVNAVPHRTASDQEFENVREQFKEREIAEITFAVAAIRAFNMLNASFHTPVPEKPYAVAE